MKKENRIGKYYANEESNWSETEGKMGQNVEEIEGM